MQQPPERVESGRIDAEKEPTRLTLERAGLDPALEYPYWPLVYGKYRMIDGKILGKITNYGTATARGVSVSFAILNSAGELLREPSAFVGSLRPGETWSYTVYYGSEGSSCRLVSVNCWRFED